MSLPDELPHTCSLARVSYTQTALGGDTEVQAAAYAADEPCWLQPANSSEIREYQKRDQRVTHKLYFNRNPGFQLGDALTMGAASSQYAGEVLTIRDFKEATAGLGILWKVMCELDREEAPA